MKLRILDDSLRLRLTRSEVERVGAGDAVNARMRVGAQSLEYSVAAKDVAEPVAELVGTSVRVWLPTAAAAQWAASEQVGIEAVQAQAEGPLKILVEKDFKCLAPREGEDQSDAYAHPNQDVESC